jgi:putative hydrolase of the HAD superfamily
MAQALPFVAPPRLKVEVATARRGAESPRLAPAPPPQAARPTPMFTTPPRVIAFDGDDTLWRNEDIFTLSQARYRTILAAHVDLDDHDLDARLAAVERRNLATYGYGVKGFTLSMIETAVEITQGAIPASDIAVILRLGQEMLVHPVEVLDGVREVLTDLKSRDHELWLITKGDLFDQESKIARSGLEPFFHRIEIVSEKDQATYRRIMARGGTDPAEFAMVGNTVRSDILPVLALGARAFHVPYHTTWSHEVAAAPEDHAGFATLESIIDLPAALGA